MPNSVLNRRLVSGEVRGDFSAGLTGVNRLTALNTGSRFNPANSTALSVAFFVYPTQLTAGTYYPYVRLDGGGAAGDGWYVQRSGASNQFEVGYSNGLAYFNVDAVSPSVNTWYLVVGNWLNTGATPTIELIVYGPAGALTNTTNTGVGFVNAAATGPLYIGGLASSLPGEAHIDKVGIWNRAQSGANVLALWNGGVGLRGSDLSGAGLGTSLAFWWDLDERTGKQNWPGFIGGAPLSAVGTVTRENRAGF